jgi:flagellar basal-body rod modification protein FlgD
MIDSVGTVPGGANTTTPAKNGGTVDKEAFLKLLVAQLKQQDPLSPMEGTEFVAQLAQFSMVEQAMAQSAQLELISLQLTGIASNEAVSLIGKEVTVRGDKLAFDGENATGMSVTLAEPAETVTVTIRDENGNAVRTMEMGAQDAGPMSIEWDGTDDNGQKVAAGNYSVEVSARDASGAPVEVSQDVTGRVVGVSFEKGYPELELDSGQRAPISDLVSVAGVDEPPPPEEP